MSQVAQEEEVEESRRRLHSRRRRRLDDEEEKEAEEGDKDVCGGSDEGEEGTVGGCCSVPEPDALPPYSSFICNITYKYEKAAVGTV